MSWTLFTKCCLFCLIFKLLRRCEEGKRIFVERVGVFWDSKQQVVFWNWEIFDILIEKCWNVSFSTFFFMILNAFMKISEMFLFQECFRCFLVQVLIFVQNTWNSLFITMFLLLFDGMTSSVWNTSCVSLLTLFFSIFLAQIKFSVDKKCHSAFPRNNFSDWT